MSEEVKGRKMPLLTEFKIFLVGFYKYAAPKALAEASSPLFGLILRIPFILSKKSFPLRLRVLAPLRSFQGRRESD